MLIIAATFVDYHFGRFMILLAKEGILLTAVTAVSPPLGTIHGVVHTIRIPIFTKDLLTKNSTSSPFCGTGLMLRWLRGEERPLGGTLTLCESGSLVVDSLWLHCTHEKHGFYA